MPSFGEVIEKDLSAPIWSQSFGLLLLGNFAVLASLVMVMTVLPVYLQNLGMTTAAIGFVVALFNLSGTSIRLFIGREMDRSGTRVILLGSVALFAIATLSYIWATTLMSLLWLRILHGLMWGVANTAATVAIIDNLPLARRGEGLNLYAISAALPTAFMPWLALMMAERLSFPAVFLVSFALPAIGTLVFLRGLPRETRAFSGPQPVLIEPLTIIPGLAALAAGSTYGAVTTLTPLYLLTLGSVGTGLFFLIFTVAVTVSRFFLRRVYDRHGMRPFLIFSPPAIAAGLILLSLEPSVALILISAFLYGAGFGVLKPAIQAWSVDRAPASRRAAANAMFYSGFELGVAVGAVLFGFLAGILGYSGAYRIVALAPLLVMLPSVMASVRGAARH